jgi:mono/diheme cytochrome c family protein
MIRMTIVFLWLVFLTAERASAQSGEPVDFGRQIQPILAKRCYACHGPDKGEGGLRLNQRKPAFEKLESGRQAIVPKDVAHSELMRRILSKDEADQMPPEGPRLTETQIDLLRRWIEEGAEWREHWAFIAPQPQQPPTVKHAQWVANPIDAFILSKLEQKGLTPAPPASKTALLRRITYDLTGLPPTPAEVEAFLADTSPEAYEQVVDRLLKSERYGEHWARHWLDVVRYADTNSFERDGVKPNAWRYRDYVIRAFNSDKPYDQFVREQLAGDELPEQTSDGLIATGFYRLGLWDDEPADRLLALYDGFDDIITTTSQAFLGLTVNCARCHDHKIDPIPQHDYYSMLAFFQGVTPNGNPNPNVERPIFEDDAAKAAHEVAMKEHREKLDATQAGVSVIEKEFREKLSKQDQDLDTPDMDEVEYRFYRDSWQKLPDFDVLKPETVAKLERPYFDISPATREFSFGFVFVGTLKVPADGEYTFIVDSDDGSRLTINGKELILYDGIHGTGKPQVAKVMLKKGRIPIRLDYFQGPSGAKELIVKWSGPGFEQRYLSAETEDGIKLVDRRGKRKDFVALMKSQGPTVLGRERHQEYTTLVKQLEELKRFKPEASFALCVTEVGPNPPETFILQRGNPQAQGEKVVPAFLSPIGGGKAVIPTPAPGAKSSGRRLALANWIVSPENRLSARVMANRIWQHHFGRGIVRSPNNFGLLGDAPTHPELLDWLAAQFIRGGWHMKSLHKLIVMSNAYRMSSQPNEKAHAIDPLNNLFWRFDMRRLSAEEIRDSILAVDGRLNSKMYGPGIYPEISDEVKAGQSVPGAGWGNSSPEDQARRSIYVHVKRSLVLPILFDFDFADTDGSCAARFVTTQPTQALAMLNGKFLNDQAAELAKRLRKEAGDDVRNQVTLGYRLTLNREPEQTLVERGLKLIDTLEKKHSQSADQALNQFCLMVLNLNEFLYLD